MEPRVQAAEEVNAFSRRATWLAAIASVLLVPGLEAQNATPPVSLPALSASLQQLADRIGPSVVQIFATAYAPPDDETDRGALLTTERTTASGVILDPDGYIVTNAHVVNGAIRVQVEIPLAGSATERLHRSVLRPHGRVMGAQVVAIDEETDLAVLKVEATGLPALTLGDSESLKPGQLVLAFGSPLGLEGSVSMGVVSATARQLEPDDPMIYIQTDAAINPGSSGGPLVDAEGRVMGINTLIYSQSGGDDGIAFAAPSNIVRNVFEQIRKTGRVRRGEIGVVAQTITPLLAAGLQLPQDWGVIISDVDPEGPGARGGLRPGDIILTLDGKTMENGRQFLVNFYTRAVGETVTLQVLRGREPLTLRVPVAERADDPARFAQLVRPDQHLVPRLGLLALNLDDTIVSMLPALRSREGVVVAATASDAPVSRQGQLRPGDVIRSVNAGRIASLEDLRRAVDVIKPGGAAVLQVEREGRLMYLAFAID